MPLDPVEKARTTIAAALLDTQQHKHRLDAALARLALGYEALSTALATPAHHLDQHGEVV